MIAAIGGGRLSVWGLLLLAVIALALAALIAWPLLRPEPVTDTAGPQGEREVLDEELARALAAIREIEEDHRAGHLTDTDFANLNDAERARAVVVMRRLDELDE